MRRFVWNWRSLALGLAAAVVCAVPAPADHMSVPALIAQCGACHGADGNSRNENIPSLAAQPEFFLLNQLVLMREGVRPIEPMATFVRDLSDNDIIALAKHFAALPAKRSEEKIDPVLARRGAELAARLHCGSCHLSSLAGQEQMPRLAAQRVDYLNYAMKALRDNKRVGADSLMSAAVFGIADEDILALAHYAASR